jgi:hypothetical protein
VATFGVRLTEKTKKAFDDFVRARRLVRERQRWRRDAKATPDNLRLRCRAHNQLHAEECFGRKTIAQLRLC